MAQSSLTAPELQERIFKWFEYDDLHLLSAFAQHGGVEALTEHFTFIEESDTPRFGWLPVDLTEVAQRAWQLAHFTADFLAAAGAGEEAIAETPYFAAKLAKHLVVVPALSIPEVPPAQVAVARTLAEAFGGWVPNPTEPARGDWSENMVAASTLNMRSANLSCLLSGHASAALLAKTFAITPRRPSSQEMYS